MGKDPDGAAKSATRTVEEVYSVTAHAMLLVARAKTPEQFATAYERIDEARQHLGMTTGN